MSDRKEIEEAIYNLIVTVANKKTPPEFLEHDIIPIQLVVDVMINEHGNISDKSMANLVGAVAFLLEKLKIPAARFTDEHGNKLWSIEQIAEFMGVTAESLEEEAKKVAVNPKELHPLQ